MSKWRKKRQKGKNSVGGGDERGRSMMKWQTGCQTPHGSESLTQTDGLSGWKRRERWKEGKRMDGMKTGEKE